jgi:hypothetical protein
MRGIIVSCVDCIENASESIVRIEGESASESIKPKTGIVWNRMGCGFERRNNAS